MMSEASEPSAVCLKAAYRLLTNLNNSPEPPSLDTLATMIEESLRYAEAISLISEAEMYFANDGQMSATARVFQAFVDWAQS